MINVIPEDPLSDGTKKFQPHHTHNKTRQTMFLDHTLTRTQGFILFYFI